MSGGGVRRARSLRRKLEVAHSFRATLLCVSLEPRRRRLGEVTVLPWREFLDQLWAGELE